MNNRHRRSIFQAGGQFYLFLDQRFSGYMQSHTHEFWQCVFVKRGHILQMHGNTKLNQQQGEIYITPPQCEHSLFAYGDDTVYYCLSYSAQIMSEVLSVYPAYANIFRQAPIKFPLSEKTAERVDSIFNIMMFNPRDEKPGGSRCEGYHLTCAALIAALGDIAASNVFPDPSNKSTIQQAAEYLDQYYFLDITTESISEKFHMSKTAFYNQFVKEIGVTPKQYIKEKRFHEALRLMHDTDMPLHAIAEKVGYMEFSTFYRNFYRMTGQSPSDYRSSEHNE